MIVGAVTLKIDRLTAGDQISEYSQTDGFIRQYRIHKEHSLYYRVVVIRTPLQGLCYTVEDALD